MGKINVVYIISYIDKAMAFEWIAERLDSDKFELSFILLNSTPSYLATFLKEKDIRVEELLYTGKKDVLKSVSKVYKLLKAWKTDIIHCHLIDANFVGLIAGKLAGVSKRIFTRHNSTYHKHYLKKGVWFDKLSIRLATDIVAISKNVEYILGELDNAPKEKIHLIYHGFDFDLFNNVKKESVASLKESINPNKQYPIIGIVARYMHWKGIHYIIPAFKKLLKTYPDALLVLAGSGSGDYAAEIKELLKELPTKNYKETGFIDDLFSLYQLFDVFVHTPIDERLEAFGQIYIEAFVSKTPSIFTKSGIATEIAIHEENALIVDFKNEEQITSSMIRLIENQDLRQKLVNNGANSIDDRFQLDTMINSFTKLYIE